MSLSSPWSVLFARARSDDVRCLIAFRSSALRQMTANVAVLGLQNMALHGEAQRLRSLLHFDDSAQSLGAKPDSNAQAMVSAARPSVPVKEESFSRHSLV